MITVTKTADNTSATLVSTILDSLAAGSLNGGSASLTLTIVDSNAGTTTLTITAADLQADNSYILLPTVFDAAATVIPSSLYQITFTNPSDTTETDSVCVMLDNTLICKILNLELAKLNKGCDANINYITQYDYLAYVDQCSTCNCDTAKAIYNCLVEVIDLNINSSDDCGCS